jgi:colanic acid biosynthesis glycosyl transferase WcaI
MRQRIARDTENEAKIRIVPDTVDGEELAPVPPEENEFRRRFVPDGVFAVLHTGNMGKKQDLDLVLRTADRLRDNPHIRFYVFGDGAAKADFLRRREELRLDNVEHFPLQERWLLSHMLSGADVVLISQLPEVVDIVVPSKLLTALVSGAMIVAACAPDSETANLVRASGGGLIVPASDDAGLAKTIVAIHRGEVQTAAYRRRARIYALETFDRSAVYSQMADTYAAAANGQSAG